MSLRESKKRKSMQRIQDEAYELVRMGGFDSVTVEEIAAAAEVSPSTVYRYFGTKEGVLLWDELELPSLEAMARALGHHRPLDALLVALREAVDAGFHVSEEEMRIRTRFVFAEPNLRAALREAMAGYELAVIALIETEVAGGSDALARRVVVAMAMSALVAAIEVWAFSERSLAEVVDHMIAVVHGSLDGSPTPGPSAAFERGGLSAE
jgi:AcrR family transcriptional regulator